MDVAHLVEDGRREDLADPGDRLEQHDGLLPEHRGEDRLLESGDLLVEGGDPVQNRLARQTVVRVAEQTAKLPAVDSLDGVAAEGGDVFPQEMKLQDPIGVGAPAHETMPPAQQVARRPQLPRVAVRLRDVVESQELGQRVGVDRVGLDLGVGNGLEVETSISWSWSRSTIQYQLNVDSTTACSLGP